MRTECIRGLPVGLWPKPPLYFASDLHLGDGSPADDFAEDGHREAFEWFLDEVVGYGELTLLGDIFELWQCELGDIRAEYRDLLQRFKGYRLLRGNHDSALRKPPHWMYPRARRPMLLAEHGHLADVWNSSLGIVGRSVTIAAGVLERLGWRNIEDWKWKHVPTPRTHPQRLRDQHYVDYARKRAGETGAAVVVLGHTHRPMLTRTRGGLTVANSGCCVSEDFKLSYVKVENGNISVWKVY